jgi:hypothetical protein
MACYIKNPVSCFTKLWLWDVSSALSPGGDGTTNVDELAVAAADHVGHDATHPPPTPRCHLATGWIVGQDDVLVMATFVLVLLSSWLLRGYLVTTSYNAVVPKVWKNAGTMSLGAGLALVGLTVLLIR